MRSHIPGRNDIRLGRPEGVDQMSWILVDEPPEGDGQALWVMEHLIDTHQMGVEQVVQWIMLPPEDREPVIHRHLETEAMRCLECDT